jgi:hypothetical protein
VVRLIAQQPGVLGAQQPVHFRDDRVEELGRGDPLGHQRRHPPQRGLFQVYPGEGGDGVVHAGQQLGPGALEGADVRAVI